MFIMSVACFSQSKRYLYFFDKNLKSVPKKKAIFSGEGSYVSGLLELHVYDANNNQLIWIQHFRDSMLQVAQGLYQSFYKNGGVEFTGNYSNGYEDGLWEKLDSAGRNIDSSFYIQGTLASYVHRGYYKSGYPDSIIIYDLKKNQLTKTQYQDSNVISNEVFFTGEKGLRKFYTKGIFTSTDSVYTREEIEASFPGGATAWVRYIITGLQRNADEIIRDNRFGNCVVKFIVNKEGKVVNVEATNMQGTALADVAVRIIKDSPRWNAASQYGTKVNAYRLQPVTLGPQK